MTRTDKNFNNVFELLVPTCLISKKTNLAHTQRESVFILKDRSRHCVPYCKVELFVHTVNNGQADITNTVKCAHMNGCQMSLHLS